MKHYLEVDGVPVCTSRLVLAASMAADAVGGGFDCRCGYRSHTDAMLAGVVMRRVLGNGPHIRIGYGECPMAARENAYDNAQLN